MPSLILDFFLPPPLPLPQVMVISVKDVIENAKDAYAMDPRAKWVREWPGQVVLNVSQVYWTSEVGYIEIDDW